MSLHSITLGGKFPQLVGSQLRLSPRQCVSEPVLRTSHFSCLQSFARLSVQFPPQRASSGVNAQEGKGERRRKQIDRCVSEGVVHRDGQASWLFLFFKLIALLCVQRIWAVPSPGVRF